MTDTDLLTTEQVAQLAGCSAAYIRNLVHRGQAPPSIPPSGRLFPRAGVEAWLAERNQR